jgi:hypothetical protein
MQSKVSRTRTNHVHITFFCPFAALPWEVDEAVSELLEKIPLIGEWKYSISRSVDDWHIVDKDRPLLGSVSGNVVAVRVNADVISRLSEVYRKIEIRCVLSEAIYGSGTPFLDVDLNFG